MTLPLTNHRRDEALRRYMLVADGLAALAELMVDAHAPDSPMHRAVMSNVQALELAKIGVRAFGADPYEPSGQAEDIAIPAAYPADPMADLLSRDPEFGYCPVEMAAPGRSDPDGPWCALPAIYPEM